MQLSGKNNLTLLQPKAEVMEGQVEMEAVSTIIIEETQTEQKTTKPAGRPKKVK